MDRESFTFARAKIQQPQLRVEQLARLDLEGRIQLALNERKLVLISAPAGYGKTVALSRALHQTDKHQEVAWVTADADDDLPRLIQVLVAALEPYDLPWRVAPEALGALATGGQRKALDAVVEALSAADVDHGVIAIEDAHRLGDAEVFEWLDRLLEFLPSTWSIAMTSRIDPPLSLARLRVHGNLAEFRAEDLRFSLSEAYELAKLCNFERLDLVEPFWLRTQGWPVGLHLVLRTGQLAKPGWLADRHTFEYLASEVLEQMPVALRQFLLRCSVLPELTTARCVDVAADREARRWLEEIERRGLFVTALDAADRTLRLHDLFRDFLHERLQQELAAEVPQLLRRAAEGECDPIRRVGYFLQAHDFAAAESALAEGAPQMLLEGAALQIRRLVEQFPVAMRETSPTLAYVLGQIAWLNFDWLTLQKWMHIAGDGFARAAQPDSALQAHAFETMALLNIGRHKEAVERIGELPERPRNPELAAFAELLRYWVSGAHGPLEEPALHLGRMTELLEQGAAPEMWHRCLPHFLFLGHPGVAAQIGRYVEGALEAAGDSFPQLRAGANTLKAWLMMWDARIEDAEVALQAAEDDTRWLGRPNNLHHAITVVHGVISALRGRCRQRDAAVAALAAVDTDAERRRTWQPIYLYQVSRWYLLTDDWPAIEMLLRQINDLEGEQEWPYASVARAALNGLWALHQGEPERTCAIIEPMLGAADLYDITATRSNVRTTLAIALLRLGKEQEAWAALAPALELARQPGERLTLLLSGPTILAELAASDWRGYAQEDMVRHLREMAALAANLRHNATIPALGASHPSDALSVRECEVLERIAVGDSNKVIARMFGLSPHTVKRHVANILDKLGLATRGQAAAYWHARQAN